MFRLGVLFCCLLALVIGQNEVGNGEMLPQNPEFVRQKFYYSFNDKMDHYYCAARDSSVPWDLKLTRESCRIYATYETCFSCGESIGSMTNFNGRLYGFLAAANKKFDTKIGWTDGQIPLDRTVVDGAVCDFEASILVTLAQPTFGGQHGGYQQTDYQNNWWQVPLSQASASSALTSLFSITIPAPRAAIFHKPSGFF